MIDGLGYRFGIILYAARSAANAAASIVSTKLLAFPTIELSPLTSRRPANAVASLTSRRPANAVALIVSTKLLAFPSLPIVEFSSPTSRQAANAVGLIVSTQLSAFCLESHAELQCLLCCAELPIVPQQQALYHYVCILVIYVFTIIFNLTCIFKNFPRLRAFTLYSLRRERWAWPRYISFPWQHANLGFGITRTTAGQPASTLQH